MNLSNEYNDHDDFSAYENRGGEEFEYAYSEDDGSAQEEAELVAEARYIYRDSTDYLDANIRDNWAIALSHFRNEHPQGSKYTKPGYRRSRLFRPKSRSSLRYLEAGWAAAGFSTAELVACEPVDPTDPLAVANAEVNKALLQHRLEKTIPWFLTAVGAYQDTHVYGLCVSHQYWHPESKVDVVPAIGEDGLPMQDEEGNMLGEEARSTIFDKPAIDLIPPENIRFSPAADWRCPLNDSPYLVHLIPVFYGDVVRKMKSGEWIQRSEGEIRSARKVRDDNTRMRREGGGREDPSEVDSGDFEVIWVHRNIVRRDGEDMVYLTLGTEYLLTKPVPLREDCPHLAPGERPYVLGFSTLETHRNYPDGTVILAAPLQEELNELTNQRIDNVKLVLNKRYHVRRGANVDLAALMRNTPGGGVLMTDPERDVQVINTPDVTSSSYEETNRLSVEHDELVGNFSQQTVSAARNLNETVGGMNLMNTTSNEIQDYAIRLFLETWVEPVLRQLSRLLAYYETDATVLRVAGASAKLYQRFGIDVPTDEMLLTDLSVTVNVGLGFTDPQKRVGRLMMGLNSVLNLPSSLDRLKPDQVESEIFGALGYKNGSRFFMTMEEYQKKQSESPQQPPEDPKVTVEKMRLEAAAKENQQRMQLEQYRIDKDYEARMAELAAKEKITMTQLYERIGLDREKENNKREIKAVELQSRNNEMLVKQKMGSGI